MRIWSMGGRIHRFNENVEKNQLMKSQPLNMVFGPARLAPRTCSPSDRAGFVFPPSTAATGCRNLLLDPPKSSLIRQLERQTQDDGWPSASAQLSVRGAGKMLYNLKASRYLARIDLLKKQFGKLLCWAGRAHHLGREGL
jgi:hypothetical protein